MDLNSFLIRGYEGEFRSPSRVFARLDQADVGRVFLGALDADWFEARGPIGSFKEWIGFAPEAPIFVLEFSYRDYAGLADLPEANLETLDFTSLDDPEPPWLELQLGNPGPEGLLFRNLFAGGQPVSAVARGVAAPAIAMALDRQFSLDDYEADESALYNALANMDAGVEWIGIYDVGQGSAAGLLDGRGVPLAYFDIGGGVLGNTNTFPANLTNICFTAPPTFVLSHWDWDHWSSGAQFSAQGRTWIVPNQRLGAVHSTFAASVASAGQLLVWPSTRSAPLQRGQLAVFKCSGLGRNHSGLAIEVTGPHGEAPILLTGDARYSVANNAPHNRYTSVVVPHHGADMRNHQTPLCPSAATSRAAYSFGLHNTFQHPRPVTEQDHHAVGWAHASQGGYPSIDRNTANRGAGGLGHIGLTWRAGANLPWLPCGGQCTLGLTQS